VKRGRHQILVWPVAVLIASALIALAAEATAWSVQTVTLYGLIKMTSDLLLVIGLIWLVIALIQIFRAVWQRPVRRAEPRA
jgi:membrane-associated HD superfamily phosphohydrolase